MTVCLRMLTMPVKCLCAAIFCVRYLGPLDFIFCIRLLANIFKQMFVLWIRVLTEKKNHEIALLLPVDCPSVHTVLSQEQNNLMTFKPVLFLFSFCFLSQDITQYTFSFPYTYIS